MTEPEATKSGLYPSPLTPRPPLPEAGRGGENALGGTQIHWDFEPCVLRNVGKDEGFSPPAPFQPRQCPCAATELVGFDAESLEHADEEIA